MKTLPKYFFLFIFSLSLKQLLFAQSDTLPEFSLIYINGSIQIQWLNPYKNIIQLNIQRSKESNKNFITIHSTPTPNSKYYKYIDKNAPNDSCYYRIFILYEGTNYQFTKIKRPVKGESITRIPLKEETEPNNKDVSAVELKKTDTISNIQFSKKESNESLIALQSANKDSQETGSSTPPKIIVQTSGKEIQLIPQRHIRVSANTARNMMLSSIKEAPYINTKKIWTPSNYIYTGNDGNIIIALPDVKNKHYSITFLKEEGRPLFQIPKIEHSPFTLDKVSFLKSGWYYFELREAGKVVERNKFLITRDN